MGLQRENPCLLLKRDRVLLLTSLLKNFLSKSLAAASETVWEAG